MVSYKGPMTTRNIQNVKSRKMGHYTGICLRAGTWIEYNDLDKKETSLKKNATITPALLIYAKQI